MAPTALGTFHVTLRDGMVHGEALREAPVPVPGELVSDSSLVRFFRSAGVCNGCPEQYSGRYIFYV